MGIQEVTATSILNRCGIPGIDFVVNPYIDCRFASYPRSNDLSQRIPKKIDRDDRIEIE